MKKIKLILLFLIVLSASISYSQKKEEKKETVLTNKSFQSKQDSSDNNRQAQVVHKYLTIQAWNIVRAEHPEVIGSEMDIAMSNPNTPSIYGDWWAVDYDYCGPGSIVGGSYIEDDLDIIYGNEFPFTTINHFWLADLGDNHEPIYFGAHRKNAMQKIRALWSGKNYINHSCTWPSYTAQQWVRHACNHEEVEYICIFSDIYCQNNIAETYKDPLNQTIVKDGWIYGPGNCNGRHITLNEPLINFVSMIGGGDPWEIQDVIWESVGRICHLIEDQGVPAHAHFDTHVGSDYYEDEWISAQHHYQDITSEKALLQGGSIDLSNKTDPIRYAVYTANQVADRFPSNDDDGNLVIDRSHPDNYQDILDPIYSNITAGLSKFGENPPPGLMEEITENAGIYSIRATAGFLYWVFQQFNIQPVTQTNITLSNHKVINSFDYVAINDLTTNNIFNITNTSTVNFQAGNKITLHPGFHAQDGSSFHAFIQSPSMILAGRNTYNIGIREPGENSKDGNGKIKTDSEDISTEEIPEEFKLYQNYPNGFNPSTKITFDIPYNTRVKITVYDILGRVVATLVNSELNAGRYETIFDGSNVSSGIYYYTFQSSDYIETKKMLLIK